MRLKIGNDRQLSVTEPDFEQTPSPLTHKRELPNFETSLRKGGQTDGPEDELSFFFYLVKNA